MFTWRTKWSILRAIFTRRAPYYVQFYINGRCNLKCKQCNIVETNSGLGELSIPQMEQVAKNIRAIGGGIVLLTGGEPFLRRDLHLVARAFLQQGLDVRLQTAGIATQEQLQLCYDEGCRDINISLDSLDADKQDYINSVPGTWKKAIDAIERVSGIFADNSAICSFGCVLSRMNFREIPAILEFATRIGWYLSLVPAHIAPRSETFGFRSYDRDFMFAPEDYEELRAVISRLIEMKRAGHLLFDAESYLWSAFDFLQGKPPTWRRYNNGVCDSPNLYFAIRPNGEFTTCCDYVLSEKISLADPTFPERYRSGEVQRIAAPIVKNCKGCHYGSYPEVTLSVRDPKALLQRTKLVLLRKRREFIQKLEPGKLFEIAEEIRGRQQAVYGDQAWLEPGFREKLQRWKDPQQRRVLVEEDNMTRIAEGRIRKHLPKSKEVTQ